MPMSDAGERIAHAFLVRLAVIPVEYETDSGNELPGKRFRIAHVSVSERAQGLTEYHVSGAVVHATESGYRADGILCMVPTNREAITLDGAADIVLALTARGAGDVKLIVDTNRPSRVSAEKDLRRLSVG